MNWLGHKLSLEGISPKITKTEAILKLSPPTSLKQLRSFLGSINHLAKFIPNAATLTEKLRPLLREENEKKKLKSVKIQVKKIRMERRTFGDIRIDKSSGCEYNKNSLLRP